jgi:predicted nucleic acid-binding protein
MALAWIFARPTPTEQACADRALLSLQGAVARVPAVWQMEVANGLLVGERRHVLTAAQSSDYLRRLDQLVILSDAAVGAAHRATVLRIARQSDLSAYDASYLELALRLSAPLATFDRKLAAAAQAAGGAVFA